MKKVMFLCATLFFAPLRADNASDFTDVYERGDWGEPWNSGRGSKLENTREYVAILESILKDYDIRSVADVGCGDWQFSRYIDWTGIDYVGYDVVPGIIERNQQFEAPNIRFEWLDASQSPIPPADLLICKDVLQHLPNAQIFEILEQLPNFKYAIITNDINPNGPTQNRDCAAGSYRPVDLRSPPFNLNATELLRYPCIDGVTKQMLLVENLDP